jgi:acetylornithine deacetylase/succinyl-diaminopimelate desuccinylase family protein
MRRLQNVEMKTQITEKKAERLLRELVSTPSPSGGEVEIGCLIAEELETSGLEVERMRVLGGSRFNLLCRIGDGGETLMINGHMDTVPPHEMERPYQGRVEDGTLYGRGACDMKGGLTSMILAAEELADTEAVNTLLFTFVIDEENQGLGTLTLLLRGVKADAAIVCEPTDLKLCASQYGYIEMRLRVHGRSTHGATPQMGVNAIERMMQVLNHLRALPLLERDERDLRPYMNISSIRGGKDPWIVPHLCEVDVLISTPPNLSTLEVEEEVRRHLSELRGINLELEILEADEGFQLSPLEPIVRLMSESIEGVMGDVQYSTAQSWTDANPLYNLAGIPAVVFGPGELHHAHSSEEHVEIKDVVTCARVLVSACRGFLRRGLRGFGSP